MQYLEYFSEFRCKQEVSWHSGRSAPPLCGSHNTKFLSIFRPFVLHWAPPSTLCPGWISPPWAAHTLPFFIDPGIFPELLVGAALYGMFRRRRRGKRAGVLVELRRGFRTAFPSIHSVRSLNSKIDELLLLNSRNLDLDGGGKRRGGGICFYINEDWCADVTVLNKSCSHDDHVSCFIHCGSSPYTHTHTHTHTHIQTRPLHTLLTYLIFIL